MTQKIDKSFFTNLQDNKQFYQNIKKDIKNNKISVPDILQNAYKYYSSLYYFFNSTFTKRLVHIIVKFESDPETLKTHLSTLQKLIRNDSDMKTFANLVGHSLKRLLSESRDPALISTFIGYLFYVIKEIKKQDPSYNPSLELEPNEITTVLNFALEEKKCDLLFFLVKSGIAQFDTLNLSGSFLVQFFSYCLKKNEMSYVKILAPSIQPKDFEAFFKEAFVYKGILDDGEQRELNLLPLLKYFSWTEFLDLLPQKGGKSSQVQNFALEQLFFLCMKTCKDMKDMDLYLNKFLALDGPAFTLNAALYRAIIAENKTFASLLLDRGADVNAVIDCEILLHTSKRFSTPFFEACLFANIGMVKFLLKRGGKVTKDCIGQLQQRIAVQGIDMIELIAGIDINAQDHDGNTSLHHVISAKIFKPAIVEYLLQNKASITIKNNNGETPLHLFELLDAHSQSALLNLCIKNGNIDALKALLELPFLNAILNGALIEAIRENKADMVALLIEKGANIDALDDQGNTALHNAINDDNTTMVTLLVERGADVSILDNGKSTPLHIACYKSTPNLQIIKFLIEKGKNASQALMIESRSLSYRPLDLLIHRPTEFLDLTQICKLPPLEKILSSLNPLTTGLIELYLLDVKNGTTRCDEWIVLPSEKENLELLKISLLILQQQFEPNQEQKKLRIQFIDSLIASKISNPETKLKFLMRCCESKILFNYMLENYLNVLDDCSKLPACKKLFFIRQSVVFATPSQIFDACYTLSRITDFCEKIPFEGSIYTTSELLLEGCNYINWAEGMRNVLKAIPLYLLAIAAANPQTQPLLRDYYLSFCNEAQLRVIIPHISDQLFVDTILMHPHALQLACLAVATPSQKRLFLEKNSPCDQFKHNLQELTLWLEPFKIRCDMFVSSKSKNSKLVYEYLAQQIPKLDQLAKNLEKSKHYWKNLLDAFHRREKVSTILDGFAKLEKEAEEQLKLCQTLLEQGRKLLRESPSDEPDLEFICPITGELMQDPVTLLGNTYERAAIKHWISANGTDPATRAPVTIVDLKPNSALKQQIDAWRIKHPPKPEKNG